MSCHSLTVAQDDDQPTCLRELHHLAFFSPHTRLRLKHAVTFSGQTIQDPSQVWIQIWSRIFECHQRSLSRQEWTQGLLHGTKGVAFSCCLQIINRLTAKANIVRCRLKLKYLRHVASSSAPRAVSWLRWGTWTWTATPCSVLHPRLTSLLLTWSGRVKSLYLFWGSVISGCLKKKKKSTPCFSDIL